MGPDEAEEEKPNDEQLVEVRKTACLYSVWKVCTYAMDSSSCVIDWRFIAYFLINSKGLRPSWRTLFQDTSASYR